MIGFVVRRLLQLVPVLLLASTAIWAMIYAVPGGPIAAIAGDNASPEQIAAATAQFGLDRPVLVQYADWLWNALRGDFGISIRGRAPVLELIGQRLPATLQLAVAATIVSLGPAWWPGCRPRDRRASATSIRRGSRPASTRNLPRTGTT